MSRATHLVRPHVLQQTVLRRQSVERIVAVAPASHKAAQRIGGVRARDALAGLVDVEDVALDGCVVLGRISILAGAVSPWR